MRLLHASSLHKRLSDTVELLITNTIVLVSSRINSPKGDTVLQLALEVKSDRLVPAYGQTHGYKHHREVGQVALEKVISRRKERAA